MNFSITLLLCMCCELFFKIILTLNITSYKLIIYFYNLKIIN